MKDMKIFSKLVVSFVHISKLFLSILIANIVYAQNSFGEAQDMLEKSGRWGDYYVRDLNNNFNLVSSDLIVDSLFFSGDGLINKVTLLRLFHTIKGSPTKNIALSRFKNVIDGNKFINNQSTISFARFNKNYVAAVIDVTNDFKSNIGGIIGSNRDASGRWSIKGELNLRLENIFKNASRVHLQWQQPSQSFRYIYFDLSLPVFFQMPFGVQSNFSHEFFDKNYLKSIAKGYLTKIGPYGRWKIGSSVEHIKDLVKSESIVSKGLSLGIEGDRRNDRWIPFSGSHWNLQIDARNYKDNLGSTHEVNSKTLLGVYKNFFTGVLYLKTQGSFNRVQDRSLLPAKKILFGGSNDLRGYNEDQFLSDWYIINTIETILTTQSQSQLFVFIDQLFANDLTINPTSGFGIRLFNGSQFFDVTFAFPGSKIKDGKLHIKFNTSL